MFTLIQLVSIKMGILLWIMDVIIPRTGHAAEGALFAICVDEQAPRALSSRIYIRAIWLIALDQQYMKNDKQYI